MLNLVLYSFGIVILFLAQYGLQGAIAQMAVAACGVSVANGARSLKPIVSLFAGLALLRE